MDQTKLPWVIRANGDQEFPAPANDKTWTLKELQEIVGGPVELHAVPPGRGLERCLMAMNENGKLQGLPPNLGASLLMGFMVVGDVLVCPKRMIR
jgi:hypothetical protein